MDKKKQRSLIQRVLHLLDLIETPKNQAKINEIRGLLYEILDV